MPLDILKSKMNKLYFKAYSVVETNFSPGWTRNFTGLPNPG